MTCIINSTTSKNYYNLDDCFFLILNLGQRVKLERGQVGSYWLELAILTLVVFIALRALRWMETPL